MAPPLSRCADSAYTAPCSSADPETSVTQQTRKLEGCGHKPAAHGYGLAARQETPDNLAAHKKSKYSYYLLFLVQHTNVTTKLRSVQMVAVIL